MTISFDNKSSQYGSKARHTHVAPLGKVDAGAAAVTLDHVDERMPSVSFLTRSKKQCTGLAVFGAGGVGVLERPSVGIRVDNVYECCPRRE